MGWAPPPAPPACRRHPRPGRATVSPEMICTCPSTEMRWLVPPTHRYSRFGWRRRAAYAECLRLIEVRERNLWPELFPEPPKIQAPPKPSAERVKSEIAKRERVVAQLDPIDHILSVPSFEERMAEAQAEAMRKTYRVTRDLDGMVVEVWRGAGGQRMCRKMTHEEWKRMTPFPTPTMEDRW